MAFVQIVTEDTNTTQTLVNCSQGLCSATIFDGDENLIAIRCSRRGVALSMNVYAINECGDLSDVFVANTRFVCDGRFVYLMYCAVLQLF